MRVVADTNVLVSMLFWGKSLGQLFDLVNTRKIVLCFSLETIDELFRVAAYPHIERQAEKLGVPLEQLLDTLLAASHIAYPEKRVHAVKDDESDNRILEVALAAQASCIITGDKHLLKIELRENVPIYSPTAFLRAYENSADKNI
jgi:putative PIN family toxin of toxin-antitoxin system